MAEQTNEQTMAQAIGDATTTTLDVDLTEKEHLRDLLAQKEDLLRQKEEIIKSQQEEMIKLIMEIDSLKATKIHVQDMEDVLN